MTSRRRQTLPGWLLRALALVALWALTGSAASAQVAVLRVDPAAEPLCADFENVLAEFGVAPDPGYFDEAQRRGLDPSGDEALTMLTPPLQVQLAVVPQASDARSVAVEFRDGGSGASLGAATIPLDNGALGWGGRRALVAQVRQRLAAGAGSGQPPPAIEGAAPAEGGGELAEGEEAEADGPSETGLLARVYAGVGLGTRDVEWPAPGEMHAVETGAFVAVELGAAIGIALSKSIALGPELAYQTSLDHEIEEMHVAGEPQTMSIRAHHFEALLALTIGLGKSRNFRITPAIGYGARNLRPAVHHLLTPMFSLGGPLAKVTVRIPIGDSVALRLSPELQLISVGEPLQDLGVESSGIAFGADAAFEIVLSSHISTELTFRQANATMASTLGGDSTDVERFATLRLAWQP